MAITIPELAKQLLDKIQSALVGELGTYTFSNGVVVPAIVEVLNLAKPVPPAGTIVQGLEAVLYYPTVSVNQVFDGVNAEEEWVLHLKQHDTNKTTLNAYQKVLPVLAGVASVSSVFRNDANPLKNQPEVFQIRFSFFYWLR